MIIVIILMIILMIFVIIMSIVIIIRITMILVPVIMIVIMIGMVMKWWSWWSLWWYVLPLLLNLLLLYIIVILTAAAAGAAALKVALYQVTAQSRRVSQLIFREGFAQQARVIFNHHHAKCLFQEPPTTSPSIMTPCESPEPSKPCWRTPCFTMFNTQFSWSMVLLWYAEALMAALYATKFGRIRITWADATGTDSQQHSSTMLSDHPFVDGIFSTKKKPSSYGVPPCSELVVPPSMLVSWLFPQMIPTKSWLFED